MLDELVRAAFARLQDNDHQDRRIRELLAKQRGPLLAGLVALWRRLRGPSNSEMDLAMQRSEALERADRAERSSFEAVGEMADLERDRDAAKLKLEPLLKRIDELEEVKEPLKKS